MNKITYNAAELAEILGISVSGAYDLFHREDFPTLRIGRRLLVTKNHFEQWLLTQSSPEDKVC